MTRVATAYQGPGCPRCWTPIPATLLDRRVYCGECALEFTGAVFHPVAASRTWTSADDATGSTQCARHARNPAVAACERCGAFICGLCRVEVSGQVLCAACFDRVRADGSMEGAVTTFRSWRTLGFHLSLLGIFIWPLGMLIGPASLYATARGISQSRKDGDERSAGTTILALVLGVLVTVGGVLMPFSFYNLFSRQRGR